jgi:hypothetical protein
MATVRLRRSGSRSARPPSALLPAVLWTLFALVYYGFPFPNTAYAKLAMGIDPADLRTQGALYPDRLDRSRSV